MSESFNRAFDAFTRDTLRPVIDMVPVRKRNGLYVALAAAAVMFVVFAVVVYFLMQPYRKMLEGHANVSIWPLVLLTPAALAMVAFTIVYILKLHGMVKEFRTTLVAKLTEFVDPGLAHEIKSPAAEGELEESLLFGDNGKPVAGTDRFRGRSGNAIVEFRDMHIPLSPGGEKKGGMLTGVFMKATYDKSFREPLFVFPAGAEASLGGIERGLSEKGAPPKGGLVRVEDQSSGRQVLKPAEAPEWGRGFLPRGVGDDLEALRRESGTELYLGCRGRTLYAALLSRSERIELPGTFDRFDFGNCREFCHKAMVALRLARELGDHPELWES